MTAVNYAGAELQHARFQRNGCGTLAVAGCATYADNGKTSETGLYVFGALTGALGVTTALIGIFHTRWGGGKEGAPRVSASITPTGATGSLAMDF
jgi:hypothetical protein